MTKVAVVGGGSTYTPELVDGFARLPALLAVDELVLIDPAAERLGDGRRVLRAACSPHYGHPGRVRWTVRSGRGSATAPTSC